MSSCVCQCDSACIIVVSPEEGRTPHVLYCISDDKDQRNSLGHWVHTNGRIYRYHLIAMFLCNQPHLVVRMSVHLVIG